MAVKRKEKDTSSWEYPLLVYTQKLARYVYSSRISKCYQNSDVQLYILLFFIQIKTKK